MNDRELRDLLQDAAGGSKQMELANELALGAIPIRYEPIFPRGRGERRDFYAPVKTVYGRVGLPGSSFKGYKKRLKALGVSLIEVGNGTHRSLYAQIDK